MEFPFKDTENLNSEKDYYNDLPGKLPPEMFLNSDPVEGIPQTHQSQPLREKKLTIQVILSHFFTNFLIIVKDIKIFTKNVTILMGFNFHENRNHESD